MSCLLIDLIIFINCVEKIYEYSATLYSHVFVFNKLGKLMIYHISSFTSRQINPVP